MNETELVCLIAKGNEVALSDFIDLYNTQLYYYVFGIIGDRDLAEEVVSDVFFKIWISRKQLPNIANINAWLVKLAHNMAINTVRKEQKLRQKSIPLDNINFFSLPRIESPLNSIISTEELEGLNKAINQLPPKCKKVFFLAKIEKMKYSEIADILGISVATINYHVMYAKNILKEILQKP